MKTICAASVLFGQEAFSTLGEVVVRPDRAISRGDLLDADALVIRSKTAVTRELLAGTRVSFVGTATAGFDHIDGPALREAGVFWCPAPGCNANSVAEYIASALLCLAVRHGFTLAGRTIGVVGVGQVGRRVVRKAEALGMRVLQNDPPRARAEGAAELRPLEEILPECDVVTLHVPLSDTGPHATRRMVNCRFLSRLKPGAVFLNASRGEVVDEEALRLALAGGQISRAALDVWEQEPDCHPDLLEAVELGTPHIAGYSWDGKLAGTEILYREACRFFELPPAWSAAGLGPAPASPVIPLDPRGLGREEALWAVVRRAYDITVDDAALRQPPEPDAALRARRFERLRKNYPDRREFTGFSVRLAAPDAGLAASLSGLGFKVS